ncbi:hypothetical protein I4U23_029322 [Adineta vaga]|nr:hypothetical protein I4U23_029322 [Adineta vaga]
MAQSLYPAFEIEPDNDQISDDEGRYSEIEDPYFGIEGTTEIITRGISLNTIVRDNLQPPCIKNMDQVRNTNSTFLIKPFKFDPLYPDREPIPIDTHYRCDRRGDTDHVHMPCSEYNMTQKKESIWYFHRKALNSLKAKCDSCTATVEDLKKTIRTCVQQHYDLGSLEKLINDVFSNEQRGYYMSTVLSNICHLALNVDSICTRSPRLLRVGSNGSVTLSQRQAASLLACAFFCLFPNRSNEAGKNKFKRFPNPNFNGLYKSGAERKLEKLRCIFHYFRRITEKMPTGVITFQRCVLPIEMIPPWERVTTDLCDLHLTTNKRIEDINGVLQVDFANKYIGGGVLGNGCVQEEIRFSICSEMLVSLLICERMEKNECIRLIGCERYSSYKGYSNTFKFDGDYRDATPKDNWGRKWCHLVAMDAIYFGKKSTQYDMRCAERELTKAYASFRSQDDETFFNTAIATGNWGCGAFNGDRQLKAIIQLMAASEARASLIYAAFGDKNTVDSLYMVYDYLKGQKATVADLYRYLRRYFTQVERGTLFDFIICTPVSSVR